MTTRQAARAMGCSASHVRNLITKGKLKATYYEDDCNQHGYRIEIAEAEVERYKAIPQAGGWPRGKPRS